ncbi:MAG: CRP-like cAMP-binding protein [Gammaproteobacteria bacterium]|jgi:CRP-like cAMP-binding protein
MKRNLDCEAAARLLVPIDSMSPENQTVLLAASNFQPVFDGQSVYVQGHQDNYIHYLIDGTVEFLWNGKNVSRVQAGSKAARRALERRGRKRYTVRAVSNCLVLRIPRQALDLQIANGDLRTATQHVEVSEIAAEKSSNWMIKMLQSELFAQLPVVNIQKIFGRMERMTVEVDEIVINQGDIGYFYYVIERGYCEVARRIQSGKEIHLADLGAGAAFGEVALIAKTTRTATVTMLSNGTLMRLSRDDFYELIRDPLVVGISTESATDYLENGATWLDIRYPEEHARRMLHRSENIPFNILRLQANRLDKKRQYIVCSNDPTQSAVGAFLLVERGLSVVYLEGTVAALIEERPSLSVAPVIVRIGAAARATTSAQQRSEMAAEPEISISEETTMDVNQPASDRFENTIEKIDRLYSQKEWEAEKAARVPLADYAHTVTGQRLADLIDEIEEKHEEFPPELGTSEQITAPNANGRLDDVIDIAPDSTKLSDSDTTNVLLVDTHAPMPVSADETLHDDDLFNDNEGLSDIIQDFEYRVRDHVEAVAFKRMEGLQQRYQDKLKKIRLAAAVEVRKRQELSRRRYEQQYKKKEIQLRAHYKKLMALANKISEQKAQLQAAKKQFEDKLSAANAVYKQVEDMRKTLRQHIEDLPPSPAPSERHSA